VVTNKNLVGYSTYLRLSKLLNIEPKHYEELVVQKNTASYKKGHKLVEGNKTQLNKYAAGQKDT
jgi:hypothetical protein